MNINTKVMNIKPYLQVDHGEEDTEQIRQMLKEENITMLEEDEVVGGDHSRIGCIG